MAFMELHTVQVQLCRQASSLRHKKVVEGGDLTRAGFTMCCTVPCCSWHRPGFYDHSRAYVTLTP